LTKQQQTTIAFVSCIRFFKELNNCDFDCWDVPLFEVTSPDNSNFAFTYV
jgi:hypothetical protein